MPNEMTQVKFTIEASIVAAFKTRCESEGVSMTSVIRQWMISGKPTKNARINIDTRPHRRKTVQEVVALLESLLQQETDYCDAIPEVFETRRASAEWACEQLETAIDCLTEAF